MEKKETVKGKRDFQGEKIEQVKEMVYSILDRVYPALPNFPKAEKFSLCELIKLDACHCASQLTLSFYLPKERIKRLQRAQAYLECFRDRIYFSYRRKYISNGFWEDLDLMFNHLRDALKSLFKY